MTYVEAVARLANHSDGSDGESLGYAIWCANQAGKVPDLAPFVADVLSCLAVVNIELNGEQPSETFERRNPQVIADISGSVVALIADLLSAHRRWSTENRFQPDSLELVRDAALRVTMGWNMVLAGDHDNLITELELEWNAAV